jgi:putative hydrolase of the HAD superfamily
VGIDGPVQRVVFDLGGVFFRWEPLRLLQEVFPAEAPDRARAAELAQAIFQTFDRDSDWALFDLGLIEPRPLADRIARRTGLRVHDLLALMAAIPPHMAVQAGTVDILLALQRRGLPLFYLSNMPACYAQLLESSHGFFSAFHDGIFSARVGLIKPDPAIFASADQRFGAAGHGTLFIDDVAGNIAAAEQHGWQGLLFEHPAQCRAALVERGVL